MSELLGIVRFTFHPGKVEEFKALYTQALDIVREKDVGTLQYDVFFNADESEAITLERFVDEAALIQHSQNIAELMAPITATGDCRGEILGDISDELRSNMEGGVVGLFTLHQAL